MKRREPVFAVSTGRSGSTMITRCLAEHPSICSFHELRPTLNFEAFVKWKHPAKSKWVRKRIRNKRDDIIEQVTDSNLIYFESALYYSLLIKELSELYNAKFIHIYRDGRYFVRSAIERGWDSKEELLKYRIKTWIRRNFSIATGHPKTDKNLDPPSNLKTRFERLAWLWVEKNNAILSDLSQIQSENKFSIPLEKFNKKTLINLLDFIGIPTEHDVVSKIIEIADQKPNKSKKFTSLPVTEWSDWEKKRFNEIAGDMMIKLGYSGSDI